MAEPLSREQMAWRVAHDFEDGAYVNLGVGIPLMVVNFLPENNDVIIHSENGILGMEALEEGDEPDWNLVNAGKQPVKMLPGGSFFHHADSFLMVRGGHLDYCVLGAYEVSQDGDLANWRLPQSKAAPAVGGAMDLAYGAKKVYVLCDHNSKDGSPKLVEECSLPLTGAKCVDRVFTDIAVVDVTPDGLIAREMVDGMEFDELEARTGAPIRLANDWKTLTAPDALPKWQRRGMPDQKLS